MNRVLITVSVLTTLLVSYSPTQARNRRQLTQHPTERNPTAAAKLDADITRCIERLADRSLRGQSHGSVRVLSCGVGAFHRFGSTTSDSAGASLSAAS